MREIAAELANKLEDTGSMTIEDHEVNTYRVMKALFARIISRGIREGTSQSQASEQPPAAKTSETPTTSEAPPQEVSEAELRQSATETLRQYVENSELSETEAIRAFVSRLSLEQLEKMAPDLTPAVLAQIHPYKLIRLIEGKNLSPDQIKKIPVPGRDQQYKMADAYKLYLVIENYKKEFKGLKPDTIQKTRSMLENYMKTMYPDWLIRIENKIARGETPYSIDLGGRETVWGFYGEGKYPDLLRILRVEPNSFPLVYDYIKDLEIKEPAIFNPSESDEDYINAYRRAREEFLGDDNPDNR